MALFNRFRPAPQRELPLVKLPDEPVTAAATDEEEPDLPPSRMRGTEPLYGYVVGLELLVVAVLTLVIHGGKGAPKHPQTALQIAGLVASIAFFAVLQLRSRTVVAFSAIVAAFVVTLSKVPNSLQSTRIFALAVPLAYGLIITQRQRKAMRITGRPKQAAKQAANPRKPTERRANQRKRATKETTPAGGPRASSRYTPPKPKRGTRTR